MDDILERLHKRLHHEDRRLITSIRKHIKFLNSNIESLRTHSRAKIAFLQVKRDIESGQYSAEDMKNVFKLKDENRDK